MHSANFGISGDRTENVLWRLHNGELEDVSPKIIVLSVGQENYGDSPDIIAEGIRAICAFIRSKQPQAFLVLLVTTNQISRESLNKSLQTLLPRGGPNSPLRARNERVNQLMADNIKGNSRVQLVNIDTGFVQVPQTTYHHLNHALPHHVLQVDGSISHHDMFDYVSLTQKGYTKAFEPVNDLLSTLLQEMEGELGRTEAEGAAE